MDTHTTPLLTVVVPFYNVEAYIGDCLESIRTQLLEDIEVVMVDDGSQDGSRAIAERYVEMDPRFRLVRQENQGLGPARNTGTEHALGKYLTFVDSDDLVAPRAYTLMVGSLEETGSAFAAGNAYRFSSTKGVYQSWTHRQPFSSTKLTTTIEDSPVLMRDRMIWNKVYRRSFWDAGGYEFPAIRYEDYMVTLRAYLEAPAVDVFSDHVYFWRDRESGDSITQQAARADNALDRFLSAMMVLDVLDEHEASQEVRERVHAYFIHIDLVALSESMVSVPAEDRADLEKMTIELAQRLKPGIGYETTRLARLVHESLLAGDLTMVANLASWRLSGDTKTFGKKLARHPRPQVVPTALGAVVSRRKPQSPLKARKLKTTATSATWSEQVLTVTAATTLRPQFAHRARVVAQLKWGIDIIADVPVSVTKTPKGLDLTFTIDSRVLRGLGDEWKMAILWVELRLKGLLWRGQVRFSTDACPGIRQISDGSWVQPRGIGWWFGLQRLTHPTVIERIELDGDLVRVIPAVGNLERPLEVRRPAPSPLVEFRLAEGDAEIPVAALLADDPADNLITGVAERAVVQVLERRLAPLWRFNEINENNDELSEFKRYYDEYTYLAGDPVTTVGGNRRLTIGRGWYGMLVVQQEPVGDHVEGLTPMEEAEGTGEDAEMAEAL